MLTMPMDFVYAVPWLENSVLPPRALQDTCLAATAPRLDRRVYFLRLSMRVFLTSASRPCTFSNASVPGFDVSSGNSNAQDHEWDQQTDDGGDGQWIFHRRLAFAFVLALPELLRFFLAGDELALLGRSCNAGTSHEAASDHVRGSPGTSLSTPSDAPSSDPPPKARVVTCPGRVLHLVLLLRSLPSPFARVAAHVGARVAIAIAIIVTSTCGKWSVGHSTRLGLVPKELATGSIGNWSLTVRLVERERKVVEPGREPSVERSRSVVTSSR